jgi:hypothetical protein
MSIPPPAPPIFPMGNLNLTNHETTGATPPSMSNGNFNMEEAIKKPLRKVRHSDLLLTY